MEYILYCDESSDKGPKYSDFFGGCIVNSKDAAAVIGMLQAKKRELHLDGEIKWTKVTANYLEHYIQIIDLFFDLIRDGKIKMRIMFRKNEDRPHGNELPQKDDKYFKLYYQFIKHSFGLKHIPEEDGTVFLRIYFDQLPDTKEKLYRHINKRIRELLPNFNIGISTGRYGRETPDWDLPYSHWRFVPR